MATIPKFNKKLSSFLASEEGRISKEKLIKTGTLISAIAIGGAITASNMDAADDPNFDPGDINDTEPDIIVNTGGVNHFNRLTLGIDGFRPRGQHAHHAQHSNHSSY